ncbi:Cys-Gln thioester bond-forming surface protein [Kitasatospora sp. NPDC056446]|uniref:Cys-Gln thioester bond-forming surface protein n=1 Tax=Kitasatospora sp. NPDC056446 TaxID=3345819 RepID=UPI0036C37E9E
MLRTAAVVLTTAVVTGSGLATAPAATADSGLGDDGVSGTLYDGVLHGALINVKGYEKAQMGGVFELLTDDDGSLLTYCIDLPTAVVQDARYQEVDWADAPTLKDNDDAGKVNWVLQHAYPKISKQDLGELVHSELSDNDAAAATQAAIWHFSDHVTATPTHPGAAALTEYLVSHAEDVEEPGPSLSLGQAQVTGESGTVLGPIRITSASGEVSAALDTAAVTAGVALTDRAGTVVSDGDGRLTNPAAGGDSLYVKAPADARPGSATITATTSLKVPVGRAFTSPGSQSLIIAGSTVVSATAHAKASWTAATPTPSPSATATPSPSATASASTSPPPGPAPSPTATATASATASGSASASPSPSGRPPTSASTSPAPTAPPSTAPGTTPTGGTTAGSELASTGADGPFPLMAGVGAALILVGGGTFLTARRRDRRRATAHTRPDKK